LILQPQSPAAAKLKSACTVTPEEGEE
jgi:hypothetical protein